ncbi:MAG: SpoIIE family protein phosphatase [Clostridia bacterium]|nr:SpoIIE family protein phosphatase [Clostridia bacterium]
MKKLSITKRQFFCEVGVNLALACAFVLLSTQKQTLGALAFGLLVGCVYCGRVLFPLLFYVITGFFVGVWQGFICLFGGVVLCFVALIYFKKHKKIKKWSLFLYMALAHGLYFFYHAKNTLPIYFVLCFVLGVFSAYVTIYAFRAIFIRGLKYNAGVDEKVCIFLVFLGLLRGLANFTVGGVSLTLPFATFCILIALTCISNTSTFCTAICFALSETLNSGSLTTLAIYPLWVVVALAFVSINKYLAVSSLLLVQVAICYFFEVYGVATTTALIMVCVACMVFCVIPKKLLFKVKAFLGKDQTPYSPRQMVNRMRVNFARRLYDLSEVFFALSRSFKSLTRGVMSPEQAVFAITEEIVNNTCKDCPQRNRCWRQNSTAMQNIFEDLVSCGIDRGRVSLLDLPINLTSECLRTSSVLATANTEVSNYKQYYLVNSSYDNSRRLLASVTDGIGKVMLELSKDSKSTVGFDSDKEKKLLEQLTFFKVLAKEAVVFCEGETFTVLLVVDKKDADKPQIVDVVSKVCCTQLFCSAKESTYDDNWCTLYFSPKHPYDMSVGMAKINKAGSEVSGDTYSFLRLPMGKYLLALCDGMGSGQRAEEASSTAIGLIENFYRAGFDNDLIFTTINKLLTAINSEVFRAVDICMVDLNKGIADFIKLGAPLGMTKTKEQVSFIEGASLPVGIVEEIQPTITKRVIRKGDYILLATDGFWDAFSDKNIPATLLSQTTLTNPEILAQNLLEQALKESNGVAKDDTTVIVAKVY